MLFRFAKLLCCVLCLCLAGAGAGNSFEYKPLPQPETITQEEFDQKTVLKHEVPFNDDMLEYQIRLPDSWTKREFGNFIDEDIDAYFLGDIARYDSPPYGDLRGNLVIQAIGLEHEILASDWLKHYILSNGYSLEILDEKTPTHARALYVLIEDAITYVVRVAAYINGNRMVFVRVRMPMEYYQDLKDIQAHILNSFQLLQKDPRPIEKKSAFSLLDVLAFKYPKSWELRADRVQALDELDATLINKKQIDLGSYYGDSYLQNGRMNISLLNIERSESLAEEVKATRDQLQELGLELQDFIESRDMNTGKEFLFKRTDIYQAYYPQEYRSQELWLSIMFDDEYYYFISLLTPPRDTDFLGWARNKRAYEILLESFR